MMKVKDSGVPYIGNIPISWYTKKIKYVAVECSENGLMNPKESQYIGLENIVGYSNRIIITNTEYELSIQKKCYKDNILFGKLRPYLSKVIIAPFDGFCTGEFLELTKYKGDIRFLRYSLLNANLIDTINMSTYGAKMPRANSEFIMNCYIAYPTYNEQNMIADFLDTKCEEIDALVMDIQTEIDTLEEYKRSVITEKVTKGLNSDVEIRDSGIDWIGIIPAHWEVERGKYVLKYIQKPVKENDGVITCFRDGEVTLRSRRREDGFTMADKEIGYQGIDIGDLVVHGMDGFAGAIGISDSRGKASPVLNVLVTGQNKRYIMYFLRSMAYNNVFLSLATGIRVRSCDLRWNKLAELYYPIPPLGEQNRIVEYLDTKCVEIDSVIRTKKEQLIILGEYKKAIIYEYVTGKKQVRA